MPGCPRTSNSRTTVSGLRFEMKCGPTDGCRWAWRMLMRCELFVEESQHAAPGTLVGFFVVGHARISVLVRIGNGKAVPRAGVIIHFVVDVRVVERLAEVLDG